MKQKEAGRSAADVARQYGVSKHTVCALKTKYGGMDVPLGFASNAKLGVIAESIGTESGVGNGARVDRGRHISREGSAPALWK